MQRLEFTVALPGSQKTPNASVVIPTGEGNKRLFPLLTSLLLLVFTDLINRARCGVRVTRCGDAVTAARQLGMLESSPKKILLLYRRPCTCPDFHSITINYNVNNYTCKENEQEKH